MNYASREDYDVILQSFPPIDASEEDVAVWSKYIIEPFNDLH